MTQASSYPATLPSLKIIDQRLKDFVRLHHLGLSRTINYQIGQLNSTISIKNFSKQLSVFKLTTNQVGRFLNIQYKCVSLLYLYV